MLITFEGPDSSGKSTQVDILYEELYEIGVKVAKFHFPMYERPVGNLIGRALRGEVEIGFEAMQMLYVADQLDFQATITNLLNEGYIVLLDRYDLSTLAYYIAKTGSITDVGIETVYKRWQHKLRRPDMTFIFDAKHNIKERREEASLDKFEKDSAITENINDVYLKISRHLSLKSSREVFVVDASQSIQDIAKVIRNHVIIK